MPQTPASSIEQQPQFLPGVEPVFTREQIANHLRVSTRSVDFWISNGHLAAVYIGASPRVSASELARAGTDGLPPVTFTRNTPRKSANKMNIRLAQPTGPQAFPNPSAN